MSAIPCKAARTGRLWMPCTSPPHPENAQGWPHLFWSEALAMWVECLDEATWYTDAEKAVLDLGHFAGAGAVEWWIELPRPPSHP